MNTVLLVGTADTKSDEIAFMREQVLALGALVLVMDVGVLAAGHAPVDIANTEVAAAAGSRLQQVIDSGDEHSAMTLMAQGAAAIVSRARPTTNFMTKKTSASVSRTAWIGMMLGCESLAAVRASSRNRSIMP